MNIKALSLMALLASTTTLSFAQVNISEDQTPASEASAPVIVSDQEPIQEVPEQENENTQK